MDSWSDQTWLAILIVSSAIAVLLLMLSLYAPHLL